MIWGGPRNQRQTRHTCLAQLSKPADNPHIGETGSQIATQAGIVPCFFHTPLGYDLIGAALRLEVKSCEFLNGRNVVIRLHELGSWQIMDSHVDNDIFHQETTNFVDCVVPAF